MLPRLLRRALPAALAALVFVSVLAPARAAVPEAEAFIKEMGEQVVGVLGDDSMAREDKLDALKDLLNEATDLPLVARLVLGPHWRSASEEQRAAYVDAFERFVMSNMSDRLHDFGGETFEVTGSQEINERDSMVATRIRSPSSGDTFKVEWRVRRTDDSFAIIDVVAEGVSLVVSQRSEMSEVVNRHGLDGLIERLRNREIEVEGAG